jgi:diguanylate cyclase
MDATKLDIQDLHWIMDVFRSIDVGIIVLDRNYCIRVWNSFMWNHSGRRPDQVNGQNIFKLFPDIPEDWFKRKAESVFLLNNRAFTTWEQRPYLFKFKNYRPITGSAEFMYQNITIIPLVSADTEVKHIGIVISDVTDVAVNRVELEAANEQLERFSRTDALTQLNNRGYWEECLSNEFARFKRTKQPCTLIMFDIDHFKNVNDTYGHQAGDEVIRETAATLLKTKRITDIPGRYGGEEFGVILIDTETESARVFAERLRKRIEDLVVIYEEQEIRYTISIGIAQLTANMVDPTQWLECSDKALYESKRGGRNRTSIYKNEALPESGG